MEAGERQHGWSARARRQLQHPRAVGGVDDAGDASAHDTRSIDIGVPGFELFFCTLGGAPMEFMGGFPDKIDRRQSDATNS